ncbi:FMN-binding protein [Streptomyces hokutonensis]|uniref:FMN-binding protein n=1 Tax=Streptomyces hokutonensis TaxID=1306990 RepID=UPI0003748F5D|nr:FMN-binding protein [Streptomyces hokutonensis]
MHPLKRKSPLRRIVLASAVTVSGMVLLLSLKPHSSPEITVAAPAPAPSSSDSVAGDSGGSSASPGMGTRATKTVTGDSVQTVFGPVQVRVTLRNGKITKVAAVEYPKADPLEEQLNDYAVAQLEQEALSAQSADIDVVSGATYTSQGYQQSLQSALDAAKK